MASSSTSAKFSGPPRPRPPATMMSASSIDGPCCSSCACSSIVALVEKSSSSTGAWTTSGRRRPSGGLERARADEADRRGALPADVDHDRVAEGGTLPDETAVLLDEVDEVPVQPGVEPRGEAGGDVGREHGRGEQHRVVAALPRRPSRGRRRAAAGAAPRAPGRLRPRPSRRRTARLPASAADARAGDRTGDASPSDAAFASTPSEPFWSSPSWCSRKTRVHQSELLLHEEVEDLLRPRAVVLDLAALAARRRRAEREHLGLRPGLAGVARADSRARRASPSPGAWTSRP